MNAAIVGDVVDIASVVGGSAVGAVVDEVPI